MIQISKPEFWSSTYKVYVNIRPYANLQSAIKLLPTYSYTMSCSFNPKSINGHSKERWGSLYYDCIKVAKFCKTILFLDRNQKDHYRIVQESKTFWSYNKYEVSYDKNTDTIRIRTGMSHDFSGGIPLNLDSMVVDVTKQMISEIGYNEAKNHCDYASTLADNE